MKYVFVLVIMSLVPLVSVGQPNPALDAKVEAYLAKQKGKWHDLNVPYEDGKVLYDIILSHHYTAALEIGTSTGHSTIWEAWAMSKTGGKIITIEVNESRHRQALKNLEEAGLLPYVDARLGNAHELVKQLPGPFDFVFSDADKGWYQQYFIDIDPKLKSGGCYTTHNVTDGLASEEYLNYIKTNPNYTTTINRASPEGVMVSVKK
jgi:caffeoyl-CoA O-methyltransferase